MRERDIVIVHRVGHYYFGHRGVVESISPKGVVEVKLFHGGTITCNDTDVRSIDTPGLEMVALRYLTNQRLYHTELIHPSTVMRISQPEINVKICVVWLSSGERIKAEGTREQVWSRIFRLSEKLCPDDHGSRSWDVDIASQK